MRVRKTRLLTGAAAAAVTVVLTVGISAAVASVTGHMAKQLFQCGLNLARCGTPLVYRPYAQPLALQASASKAGAPVVTEEADKNQVLQDWTYTVVAPLDNLTAGTRERMGITAYDARAYQSAWIVRMQLTPAGRSTGLCAANVDDALVLRPCNGSVYQAFIQTKTANGVRAIVGYFGLSMAQAPNVPGHHLAATGSFRRGTQVVFDTPASSDLQYWYEVPDSTTSSSRPPSPTASFSRCGVNCIVD